jgi:prepilin-type N-terminal cleavage/methylation domain-containing protein
MFDSRTAGFSPLRRSAERGFTSSRRSAQQGFTSLRRSAEHGFTSLWRSAEHGFTLVEVLVALVVTSLILAIVMNGALQAKTRAVAAHNKERAVILARSLIAGRAGAPFDPASRSGEEAGLRWSIGERRVAGDARGLLLLAEIHVSVRDSKGTALSALQLRKLKAAPQS